MFFCVFEKIELILLIPQSKMGWVSLNLPPAQPLPQRGRGYRSGTASLYPLFVFHKNKNPPVTTGGFVSLRKHIVCNFNFAVIADIVGNGNAQDNAVFRQTHRTSPAEFGAALQKIVK